MEKHVVYNVFGFELSPFGVVCATFLAIALLLTLILLLRKIFGKRSGMGE